MRGNQKPRIHIAQGYDESKVDKAMRLSGAMGIILDDVYSKAQIEEGIYSYLRVQKGATVGVYVNGIKLVVTIK